MRFQLRHIPIDAQFRRQDSNLHFPVSGIEPYFGRVLPIDTTPELHVSAVPQRPLRSGGFPGPYASGAGYVPSVGFEPALDGLSDRCLYLLGYKGKRRAQGAAHGFLSLPRRSLPMCRETGVATPVTCKVDYPVLTEGIIGRMGVKP